MSLTYIEKTTQNQYRKDRPILLEITVPEIHLRAIRHDTNDATCTIYLRDRYLGMFNLPDATADGFRLIVRDVAEATAIDLWRDEPETRND